LQDFYKEILGCKEGRSSDHWADFNFFGHQLVIHFEKSRINSSNSNLIDGKEVPVPHFGIILKWNDFNNFADSLTKKKVKFIIKPYIRFKGLVGEQSTMFFKDPSENALEFKSFKDTKQIFAK
jgi:extradiol dioxygenase family protein